MRQASRAEAAQRQVAVAPSPLPDIQHLVVPDAGATPPASPVIRCVQTGGSSGPITQGKFEGRGMYLPCGIWAWVIDGRYVPGRLLDPQPEKPCQEPLTGGAGVQARRTEFLITGRDPSVDGWPTR